MQPRTRDLLDAGQWLGFHWAELRESTLERLQAAGGPLPPVPFAVTPPLRVVFTQAFTSSWVMRALKPGPAICSKEIDAVSLARETADPTDQRERGRNRLR